MASELKEKTSLDHHYIIILQYFSLSKEDADQGSKNVVLGWAEQSRPEP